MKILVFGATGTIGAYTSVILFETAGKLEHAITNQREWLKVIVK